MASASAVSWLYVSRRFDIVHGEDAFLVLSAPETWVVVRPFGGDWGWLLRDGVPELGGTAAGRRQREALRDFRVLAVDRLPGGFAVEAVERHDMADLSALKTAVRAAGEITLTAGADSAAAEHTTVAGRRLGMEIVSPLSRAARLRHLARRHWPKVIMRRLWDLTTVRRATTRSPSAVTIRRKAITQRRLAT